MAIPAHAGGARVAEDNAGGGAPMEVNVSEKVLAQVTELNGGDTVRATKWYFEQRLPEFGGLTPAQAVAHGREADVLRLLEMYDAGFLG
jgi:hypothetical protein